MSEAASEFEAHCRKIAAEFLQTAIFIDNEVALPELARSDATPKIAHRDSVPDPMGTEVPSPDTASPTQSNVDAKWNADGPDNSSNSTTKGTSTNFKELSDSLRAHGILCGLFMPDEGESNLAGKAVAASAHADLVIIDWFLQEGSSVAAREIICSLIKQDLETKGRFRLIAIYTTQSNLSALAKELKGKIDDFHENSPEKNTWKIDEELSVLYNKHSKIIFITKSDDDEDGKKLSPSGLADRMINEFAKLAEGLLPTFALSAVTAIRRDAHHVISNFDQSMDVPFLLHRALLCHPDDSLEFAVDLIINRLENIISINKIAQKTLSFGAISSRLNSDESLLRDDNGDLLVDYDKFKLCLKHGMTINDKNKETTYEIVDGELNEVIININSNFTNKLHENSRTNKLLMDFSRLSLFRREAYGYFSFPDDWQPTLTLGSVIVQSSLDIEQEPMMYYCVQPRCDSVRLDHEKPTSFPFQKIENPLNNKKGLGKERSNFVISINRDEKNLPVSAMKYLHLKPRDSVNILFIPNKITKSVIATKIESKYIFTDINGNSYEWLGDVDKIKAQSEVSKLAADLHRVGTDDFEWLRRRGGG